MYLLYNCIIFIKEKNMHIHSILNQCSTPSITKKLLGDNKDMPNLKEYLKAMLDPTVTYGIKKFPKVTGNLNGYCSTLDVLVGLRQLRSLSGNDQKAALETLLSSMTEPMQELLIYALKKKHPNRIGIKTINSIFPGLIFQVPYMGCKPGTSKAMASLPWKTGVNVQDKEDGMACLAYVDVKGARLYTRQHQEITDAFPDICSELVSAFTKEWTKTGLEQDYIHMELLVCSGGRPLERKRGNGLLNKRIKGDKTALDVRPVLLDTVPCVRSVPSDTDISQEHRYEYLWDTYHSYFYVVNQETFYSEQEAREYAASIIAQGKEGVICKDPDAEWKAGKSSSMLKIKAEFEVDLICTGTNPHKERTGQIGSLICESSDGKLVVNVAGLTDTHRQASPDVFIGRIVTVRANEIIHSKSKGTASLYLPRFIELRIDKDEPDTFEQIKRQVPGL